MGLRNLQSMNDAGMQNEGYRLSDWIVLQWIARRTKDGKTSARYFTLEFMASDLPLSERTIGRALDRLAARGTIDAQRVKRYKPSYRLAITHSGYLDQLERAKSKPAGNGQTVHSNGQTVHSHRRNGQTVHSHRRNGQTVHSPEGRKEVKAVKEVKDVKKIERLAVASVDISQSETENSDSTARPTPSAAPIGAIPLKVEGLNGQVKGQVNTGADADPDTVKEEVSPPSPKERFNALLHEKVGNSNHYPLLNRVQEEIGTVKDRAAKDAIVAAWCERIEADTYVEHIHQH